MKGETVVVVGLGASGVASARLLVSRGAKVVATDAKPLEALGDDARALASLGVELSVGGHGGVPWSAASLCVISPGVPSFEALERAEAQGLPVIGELELAARFFPDVPIVAITGSNGKSTTTVLVGEILRRKYPRTFVGGNLGTPLASVVGAEEPYDVLVLEVSSFQAERVPTLRPRSAALLNLSPNHLDRYASYQAYCDAKGNLFRQQREGDTAVCSTDPACVAQARRGRGALVTFGGAGAVVEVRADEIVHHAAGLCVPRSSLRIRGAHNADNVAAALALTAPLGVTEAQCREAVEGFAGLPHRNVLVLEHRGVRFFDDSKSTSVGASVAALAGLACERVVLVAGGRDKGGSYAPLVEALERRGRGVVLIGEAAPLIEAALQGRSLPVERARSMEEAVAAAFAIALPGDAVLLSPACSSFDMFRDYHDRGESFARAVRALAEHSPGAAGR